MRILPSAAPQNRFAIVLAGFALLSACASPSGGDGTGGSGTGGSATGTGGSATGRQHGNRGNAHGRVHRHGRLRDWWDHRHWRRHRGSDRYRRSVDRRHHRHGRRGRQGGDRRRHGHGRRHGGNDRHWGRGGQVGNRRLAGDRRLPGNRRHRHHRLGGHLDRLALSGSGNLPPASLSNSVLRQVAHVSLGGSQIRVQFSNLSGNGPVTINSAHVAICKATPARRQHDRYDDRQGPRLLRNGVRDHRTGQGGLVRSARLHGRATRQRFHHHRLRKRPSQRHRPRGLEDHVLPSDRQQHRHRGQHGVRADHRALVLHLGHGRHGAMPRPRPPSPLAIPSPTAGVRTPTRTIAGRTSVRAPAGDERDLERRDDESGDWRDQSGRNRHGGSGSLQPGRAGAKRRSVRDRLRRRQRHRRRRVVRDDEDRLRQHDQPAHAKGLLIYRRDHHAFRRKRLLHRRARVASASRSTRTSRAGPSTASSISMPRSPTVEIPPSCRRPTPPGRGWMWTAPGSRGLSEDGRLGGSDAVHEVNAPTDSRPSIRSDRVGSSSAGA